MRHVLKQTMHRGQFYTEVAEVNEPIKFKWEGGESKRSL